MLGDLEHCEIVQRVAEDRVRMRQADAAECCGFSWAGGDVNEFAGDDLVGHFDFGGEDAILGNAEFANALGDNPLVGGADRPELDIGFAESSDQ